MIAALVLAAGASRRFGAPKLLQDLHGKPLVRWSVDALLRGGVDTILVVVAPEHRGIANAMYGVGAELVVNPRAARGVGTSIARGIGALPETCEAALIALADEPQMPASLVRDVIAAHRREPSAQIVAPYYGSVPGHPILFTRTVFAELAALDGDRGARDTVARDPARVRRLQIPGAPPRDVDLPEDLARLRDERQNTSPPSPEPSTPT